jgi:hypothetical protein
MVTWYGRFPKDLDVFELEEACKDFGINTNRMTHKQKQKALEDI